MADTVSSITIEETSDRIAVHLTGISDGTGESAVAKVDKSSLLARDLAEPASLDIEQVRWSIQGHASVRFLWDHDTDDVACVLSGSGYEDFRRPGGPVTEGEALDDPRSAGGTGDILLTTNGHGSGSTYDITLYLKKRPD